MKVNFKELKDIDIVSYALVKASWLQKLVRRGEVDKACSLAKVYLDDNQKEGLYRKLLIFCAEDIGMGTPQAIQLLENIKDPIEQVAFLCRLPKNREADRFLLSVRDNYKELVKNPELEKEVQTLNIILKIADNWFSNKRLKQNKVALEEAFELLKSKCSAEESKVLISHLLDKYFLLSKHKSFGARTLLALAVLISVRDIQLLEIKDIPLNYNFVDLELVDDFALDKHTSFGKILNRGQEFWLKEGSKVNPEKTSPEMFLSTGKEKYPYN